MTNVVSKEEVEAARQVNLVEYLLAKKEPLKQEGKYWRHEVHDSLVIKDNFYSWNSRGKKGYGAISFNKDFYEMSFQDAVREVNKTQPNTDIKIAAQKTKSSNFSFTEVSEIDAARDYLINERKISPRLVNALIDKKYIAQDNHKNVLFKWADFKTREVCGKELEGTTGKKFRHIVPTNREDYGFNLRYGNPKKVYVFESPVDLLSYATLNASKLQNSYLISMNGLKPLTLTTALADCVKNGHKIESIHICVDNDEGGNKFYKQIESSLNKELLVRDMPKKEGLDWNDVLKRTVAIREKQLQQKQKKSIAM